MLCKTRILPSTPACGCYTAHTHPRHTYIPRSSLDDQAFSHAGYPFDIPQPGAGLPTYCVMAYHLPLVVAFSLKPRIQFVWGGCMLLPLQLLRPDRLGILKVAPVFPPIPSS